MKENRYKGSIEQKIDDENSPLMPNIISIICTIIVTKTSMTMPIDNENSPLVPKIISIIIIIMHEHCYEDIDDNANRH